MTFPAHGRMVNNTDRLEELRQLLAHKTGLRIPADAHERFGHMLHERSLRLGYATLDEYRDFLASDKAGSEWEEFARAFSSTETFFFRDHGQFDLLRLRLLPELIAHQRSTKTLRLWSAGCASGEEAYSLAMLVDMLLPERDGWEIFIAGTDIDSRAISRARQGRYRQWSFRMVPAAVQQRYFRLVDEEWVLDERIRRMVSFRAGNLVGEDFNGTDMQDINLILCRNMFIYFAPAAIRAVAAKFASALAAEGYLMTGHTELIGHEIPGLKSRLFAEGVVYQRHAGPAQVAAAVPAPPVPVSRPIPVRKAVHHHRPPPPAAVPPAPAGSKGSALAAAARALADQGEYERAEQSCRQALAADPLLASPYFLLAQLAQFRQDFGQAKEFLNKAIYLDSSYLAAYLELAALHERTGELPQARALRHAALGIVRTMPTDEQVEQYERTAGELAQWLAQWELPVNGNGGKTGSGNLQ